MEYIEFYKEVGKVVQQDNRSTYAAEGGKLYFDPTTGGIVSCDLTVRKANIPDKINDVTVCYIGDDAFGGSWVLTEVVIPESVTSIKHDAFSNCNVLNKIYIPDSVTWIGEDAFAGCGSLVIVVNKDSYAERYCVENSLPYRYA